ncbi:diphosphomevalonate decarboxylase [Chloroflexia bacterium SDU3-3]|nr:diphosphomevalonate decarboxylase [Chloroflexia bacterium SDU3-3]
MQERTATAIAPANIAFIKYWGVQDSERILPYNGSISLNLDSCLTTTTVSFDPALEADEVTLTLYGQQPQAASGGPLGRVVRHLDRLRALAGVQTRARVMSENNFPSDAGIASSAAAFAALTLAGAAALGLDVGEAELSRLARLSGSGSASRSIPTGYAEWLVPEGPFDAEAWDRDSYAVSLAPAEHWALADVVAVVDAGAKKIGSAENHRLAVTSAYFAVRLAEIPARLAATRQAIERRDLRLLGETMEADAVSMHAVCMTSSPASFYWSAGTMQVIHAVRGWRDEGLLAYFTIDAGPNVHVICAEADRAEVQRRLDALPLVQFTIANGGGAGARLVSR